MISAVPFVRFAQALALASLAAGCSTLPRERPTAPPLPAAWTEATTKSDPEALRDWWRGFNDPLLDQLIDEGLTSNPSVSEAIIRVSESRAQNYQSIAGFTPQVSALARNQYERANSGPPLIGASGPQREQGVGSYGATVSWEIPLFSRFHNAVVGSRANLAASLAEVRGAQVALAGDLAQAYIDLRTAQNRRAALREAAGISDQLASILEVGAKAGFNSPADAADARAQAETARAQLADVEVAAKVAMNRIAVLRAHAPGADAPDVTARLVADAAIPSIDVAGAPAAPAELIRLRPDIANAEAQAMIAAAQVGVARDALLPHLSISGSILAANALTVGTLLGNGVQTILTPMITAPLFDWGTHLAAVKADQGQFKRALIAYQDTVNQSVSEASLALTQMSQGAMRLREARAAEADAEITARGFRASYGVGIASLPDRLRADSQLLNARLTRIQAESQAAGAAISVYRAFGGGPALTDKGQKS